MMKIIKKVLLAECLFFMVSSSIFADPFQDFKVNFIRQNFKAFIKDFGGVIGGSDFNTGRSIGFPGFDVGFDLALQKEPSSDDLILKNAQVKSFGVPLIHIGVGVPLTGMDAIVRGFSYSGLTVVGGGVRYNVYKSGMITKFLPDVSLLGYYDNITYDYFKGHHLSFDVAFSWDIPVIKPFAGFGYDRTTLKTKNIGLGLDGIEETESGSRVSMGIKFSPLPLVYLYGAYSILHSEKGYNLGMGLRF